MTTADEYLRRYKGTTNSAQSSAVDDYLKVYYDQNRDKLSHKQKLDAIGLGVNIDIPEIAPITAPTVLPGATWNNEDGSLINLEAAEADLGQRELNIGAWDDYLTKAQENVELAEQRFVYSGDMKDYQAYETAYKAYIDAIDKSTSGKNDYDSLLEAYKGAVEIQHPEYAESEKRLKLLQEMGTLDEEGYFTPNITFAQIVGRAMKAEDETEKKLLEELLTGGTIEAKTDEDVEAARKWAANRKAELTASGKKMQTFEVDGQPQMFEVWAEQDAMDRLDGWVDGLKTQSKRAQYESTYQAELDKLPEDVRKTVMSVPQWQEQLKAYGRGGAADINEAQAQINRARLMLEQAGYDEKQIDDIFGYATQTYNAANREKEYVEAEKAAQERSTFGNWFQSVAWGLGQAGQSIDLALQNIPGRADSFTGEKTPVDYNRGFSYNQAEAVMSGQQKKVYDKYLSKYNDEEKAAKKAEIAMNVYQLATSMGESAAISLLTLGLGAAAATATEGMTAIQAAKAAVEANNLAAATSWILGSSAATSTVMEYHEAGYSDGTAMLMGTVAGFAEWATEKYSIESLMKMRSLAGMGRNKALANFIKNEATQFLTEGTEEMASDVINTLADIMVMEAEGKDNKLEQQYNALYKQNISEGMTDAEADKAATKAVWKAWISGVASSGFWGGVSGAIMGAGGQAMNQVGTTIGDYRAGKDIRNTESFRALAKDFGVTIDEDAGAIERGKASRLISNASMQKAVSDRLKELDSVKRDERTVSGIIAEAMGERTDRAERNAMNTPEAKQVVEELRSAINGELTEENMWVKASGLSTLLREISSQAEEEPEPVEEQTEERPKAERETKEKSYSARAAEIYADEEQRKAFERIYGTLEGSATENRAIIARTLRAADMEKVDEPAQSQANVQSTETEQVERVRFGDEYRARELMKDVTHAKANEIQRSPALRTAWENITGEKLSQDRRTAHDQIMNWTENAAQTESGTEAESGGYESYVRGMMLDMNPTLAREITLSKDLRAAWESITGRRLSENQDEARNQILGREQTETRKETETKNPVADALMEQNIVDMDTDYGKIKAGVSEKNGTWYGYANVGGTVLTSDGRSRQEAVDNLIKEIDNNGRSERQGTRAGGERPVGVDTQERAEGLAGEAGPDQSGTEQSRRIEKINALGLQQDSAAAQGVINGTDTVKNRFFRPGDSEAVDELIREDAQFSAVAALCKARGQNLILFTGLLEINESGKVILADGMQQGSDIYIRADGNEHTPLKIYEHEDTHDAIEADGGENGALYQKMKERLIRSLGGEKQFEALKAKYAEALPDGYSEYQIVQEMLSDARGTMNDFKGNTQLKAELDEEVRQQVGERRTGSRGRGNSRSFVGQLSKTANTNMLTRAEQMEQKDIDAETIRQETGWFRGADGEWRYEIDDSRARVNLNGDARFRQQHPGYARYMQLMDNMLYGELTGEEFRELRALDREWSSETQALKTAVEKGTSRLGDIMRHDGLYEAYPDIAEIGVTFEKMEAGRGAYIPAQNRIVLNEELKNDRDTLMNTLLHEVQHAIQQKEGFAGGASPEYWNREETYNRAMQKWQDEHGKIFWNLSAEDKALYREYREISASEDELLENPTLEAIEEMDALEERSDELYRELYGKEWFGKLNRLDRLMSDMEQAVKSMYWSTAGEIEARDSANRRSMTAEERKNSPPDTGDEMTVFAERGATSNLSSNGLDADTESGSANTDNQTRAESRTVTATDEEGNTREFAREDWEQMEHFENAFQFMKNKAEETTKAEENGYPMLQREDGGEQRTVPYFTWVKALDRGNYGIVTEVSELNGIGVAFYNKKTGLDGFRYFSPAMLRAVDGAYSSVHGEGVYEPTDADAPPVQNTEYISPEDEAEFEAIWQEEQAREQGRSYKAEQVAGKGEINQNEESPTELVKEALQDDPDLGDVDLAGKPEDYDFIFRAKAGKGGGYAKTMAQNFDEAFEGEDRKAAKKMIEDPIDRARDAYAKEVEGRLTTLYKTVVQELGITEDSQENRAIVWYGEGVKQGEGSGLPQGEKVEYTLEALKKEFPNTWKNVVQAEKLFRQMYDEMLDEQNASRSKVYPNVVEKAQERMAKNRAIEDRYRKANASLARDIANVRENIRATEATLDRTENAAARAQLRTRLEDLQLALDQLVKKSDVYDQKAERHRVIASKIQQQIDSGEITKNKYLAKRKDYFHHGKEMATGLKALENILSTGAEIDSMLAGQSEFTKPKAKWQGHFQQRGEAVYDANAIRDMMTYIKAANYVTHIDPAIARLRQQAQYMATMTEKSRNANKMLTWMTDYINQLAGKTNPADRMLSKVAGRKPLKLLKWINSRVKANAVAGNVRSAIAQFFNLQNAAMLVKNPVDWQGGAQLYIDYITGEESARSLAKESGFLANRYGIEEAEGLFETSNSKKFVSGMMQFGDEVVARLAWFSAYSQAQRENMADPIAHADDIVRRAVAGRGIGEVPLLQDAEVTKFFAPFQVEVNNTFQLVRRKVKEKDWGALVLFSLVAYLMNEPLRELFGFDVSWDPINSAIEAVQSVEDEDSAWQATTKIAGRLAGETIGNMAYGSQIASFLISDDDKREKFFGDTDPTRFGTGNIGIDMVVDPVMDLLNGDEASEDLLNVLLNVGLPEGGKQVSRVVDMLQTYGVLPEVSISTEKGVSARRQKGGAAAYTQGGRLKYAPDSDWGNMVKAVLFGTGATAEGMAYDGKSLSEEATQLFQSLTDQGVSTKRAADAIKGIQEITKSVPGVKKKSGENQMNAINFLAKSGMTADQQMEVYLNRVATDAQRADIEAMQATGMDWYDISDALTVFYTLQQDESLGATQKATELKSWAMQNLTIPQAQAVSNNLTYSSGFVAKTASYDAYVDAGLSPEKAAEVYTMFGRITPEAGKDSASDEQKMYSLSTAKYLSDKERFLVQGTMLGHEMETESGNPSQYADMLTLQQAGLTYDDYINYKLADQTAGKAKAVAQANIGKAAKVLAAGTFCTESQWWYLNNLAEYGIGVDEWAAALNILPMYDEDGNGSYKQTEVTNAVKAMKLSEKQQAALWQMLTGGSKNPFDVKIGNEIKSRYKAR